MTTLINATRRLKAGELDHKIEGLSDEFGELGESINEMALALKEMIRAIEENQKRYRMLFESAGDAIFMLEAEGENVGRIVSANQAAADMHGYAVDELLKLNIQDLDTPRPQRKVRSAFGESWTASGSAARCCIERETVRSFPSRRARGCSNSRIRTTSSPSARTSPSGNRPKRRCNVPSSWWSSGRWPRAWPMKSRIRSPASRYPSRS